MMHIDQKENLLMFIERKYTLSKKRLCMTIILEVYVLLLRKGTIYNKWTYILVFLKVIHLYEN